MAEDHLTDYDRWYRLAYEQRYGKEEEGEKEERHGFKEYRKPFKYISCSQTCNRQKALLKEWHSLQVRKGKVVGDDGMLLH